MKTEEEDGERLTATSSNNLAGLAFVKGLACQNLVIVQAPSHLSAPRPPNDLILDNAMRFIVVGFHADV